MGVRDGSGAGLEEDLSRTAAEEYLQTSRSITGKLKSIHAGLDVVRLADQPCSLMARNRLGAELELIPANGLHITAITATPLAYVKAQARLIDICSLQIREHPTEGNPIVFPFNNLQNGEEAFRRWGSLWNTCSVAPASQECCHC